MSIVYAEASVLILKSTRCPMLTEMSVAKPWMEESPAPLMSQISGSVPGLEFSHAPLFPPAPHGSAAFAADGPPSSAGPTSAFRAATSASTTAFNIHGRPRPGFVLPAVLAISTPPFTTRHTPRHRPDPVGTAPRAGSEGADIPHMEYGLRGRSHPSPHRSPHPSPHRSRRRPPPASAASAGAGSAAR